MRADTAPTWAKLPGFVAVPCKICGKFINAYDEDYEAVKRKGAKAPNYYHTACIKKERTPR